jgi:glycosyltransferase involved in cell wall biosynthesis
MISFIIPTFNSAKTIGRCLDSVKKQRCGKEIIVVDGRSKDDTVKIARSKRVKVLTDNGRSISTARNAGLKAAKGGYVAFVDSDVVLPAGWAEKALELLEKHTDVAGVGGPGISPEKSAVSESLNALLYGKSPKEEMHVNSLATMDVLYRKNTLDGMYFDETLETGEDPEFNLRLVKKGYKLLFSGRLKVLHHHPVTLGGLMKKWYKYGTNYPKMCSKHKEFKGISYYFRILSIPASFIAGFILAALFTQELAITGTLLGATVLIGGLFVIYTIIGLKNAKGTNKLIFPFVHTIKQLAQLAGTLVGLRKIFNS